MLAATWMVGLTDASVYLSPFSAYIYLVNEYCYDWDWDLPGSIVISDAEFWFALVNCAITVSLYFAIVAFLLHQVEDFDILFE